MSQTLRIISPVDGTTLAERPCVDSRQIGQQLEAANAAQRAWRDTPITERAAVCLRAVDAMLAMQAEIVPELAWQMGRPVRYGAGELRGFADRARHMIGIAGEALAVPGGHRGQYRLGDARSRVERAARESGRVRTESTDVRYLDPQHPRERPRVASPRVP